MVKFIDEYNVVVNASKEKLDSFTIYNKEFNHVEWLNEKECIAEYNDHEYSLYFKILNNVLFIQVYYPSYLKNGKVIQEKTNLKETIRISKFNYNNNYILDEVLKPYLKRFTTF